MVTDTIIPKKLKGVDVAIRLLTEFNLCMIASGKKRTDKGKVTYKSPYPDWKQFNLEGAELPTAVMLREWDRIYRPTLWGFVTGAISGIDVFDADSPESIDLFHKVGLTPHVITKRGEHYYFLYPGEQFDHLVYTIAGVIPHVDIRGPGGFVNCIGHNSTASYKMVKAPNKENLYDMKQLPPEVIQGIGKLEENQRVKGNLGPIGDSIPQGKRDQTMISLAGTLNHRGIPANVIEACLLNLNLQMCKPPLPDSEIIKKVKSACKYPVDDLKDIDHMIKTSGRL